MRVLLFLGALLLASPALADTDPLIEYCFTTPDPKTCLQTVMHDVEQRRMESAQQQQLDAQREQARLQMQGMALFGAGNAMIHGMNQGFQNMQQPYVSTPTHRYSR